MEEYKYINPLSFSMKYLLSLLALISITTLALSVSLVSASQIGTGTVV